jgi:hypothetical protein
MIDPLTPLDGKAELRTRLNHPQYAIYALFAIDTDYADGGTFEIYYNNSGVFAEQGVHLLDEVGAPLHAAVLARANHVVWTNGHVPHDELARRRVLHLSDETGFRATDDAWARADRREGDLETIIERYVRSHTTAFFS